MKNKFQIDWFYIIGTVKDVIDDSCVFYKALEDNNIQMLLLGLFCMSVRLLLIVSLLYDYWKIYKTQQEINFMEYYKDSFREHIVRHHIFIKQL